MASRCVSAISALHSSIAALGFASGCYICISGFRSDIADTHLKAMLYILHIAIYIYNYVYNIRNSTTLNIKLEEYNKNTCNAWLAHVIHTLSALML